MKLREAVSLYTIGSHQMSEAVVLQATEPGARVRALDFGLTWEKVNLGLGAEPGADRRIESQVPFWSAVYGNPSKCMLLGALGSLHLGVVIAAKLSPKNGVRAMVGAGAYLSVTNWSQLTCYYYR